MLLREDVPHLVAYIFKHWVEQMIIMEWIGEEENRMQRGWVQLFTPSFTQPVRGVGVFSLFCLLSH
jgi:hypothetical protein